MSDTLLRAIARDAGIQICAASTTELVERAHEIHNTTPLATAALGRTLTATAIMGSQLKVEDGSVTVQIKGNGPLGAIVCVGDSDGYVRGYLQDPAVDLPLRADGKLTIKNVGVNPTRTGVLDVLRDMGADITESNFRDEAEPMCDLTVKYSKLHGVEIGGAIIPRLID